MLHAVWKEAAQAGVVPALPARVLSQLPADVFARSAVSPRMHELQEGMEPRVCGLLVGRCVSQRYICQTPGVDIRGARAFPFARGAGTPGDVKVAEETS